MNRQSNSYTLIYSIGLVVLVGILLSVVYQVLKPMQDENIANDKKKQILAAVLIAPQEGESVSELYDNYIKESYNVGLNGERLSVNIDPFDVNVSAEVKTNPEARILPIFVAEVGKSKKYIVPIYGAGLWGPIWGYVSFNSDGKTIYGAYYAHQGETPGLGAEIEKHTFQDQFKGKSVFNGEEFRPIAVVKVGQEPSDREYVHGISGGTITSQGVSAMLENSLAPYKNFLNKLQTSNK